MKSIVVRETFIRGEGVFNLIPVFVPRRFSKAGRRLKLHPDDYYVLGTERGAIKERWFSSVIPAMNGEKAPADEGMSYVMPFNKKMTAKFLLKEAVDELGDQLIGPELFKNYGTWPMYSKFFDFLDPLFHHLHLDFESASRVGRLGKPEAYFYPHQLNNHPGTLPVTYFGFDPDVTKSMIKERLLNYTKGDNRITELSRAYRIELGTGWFTPPGVLHAPGSYLTYEPQWNSDVNSVYENITSDEVYPYDFLVENCPDDKKYDIDYVLELMDWEKNIDPHYKQKYFRPPVVVEENDRYMDKWIVYGNDYIGAKELTIFPGQSAVIIDPCAYGCIIIQGYGNFGVYKAETSIMLRFGQPGNDEFFVSESAAQQGVKITNNSNCEPMVILKHFANNYKGMP